MCLPSHKEFLGESLNVNKSGVTIFGGMFIVPDGDGCLVSDGCHVEGVSIFSDSYYDLESI